MRKLAEEEWCDLMVYYCSDETVKTFEDKEFKRKIKWDIPLLDGYKYKFLKNFSPVSGLSKGFWGLMNFSIFLAIKAGRSCLEGRFKNREGGYLER